MTVGGIVRRLVTPSHPGDPKLDDPKSSIQIRVEYLKTEFDPAVWTVKRDEAFYFPFHLDACERAKQLGDRCFAVVSRPPGEEEAVIPERLRPIVQDQLPPPLPAIRARGRKKRSKKPVPAGQRRDWVTETYG